MNRFSLVFPVFLIGCLTEENFPKTLVKTSCDRYAECDAATFETVYEDEAACEDDQLASWESLGDCLIDAGCTWDAEGADACIDSVRQADCGDVTSGAALSACLDAYACDALDLVQAAGCFAGF
jgi:hypothetical protein